MTWLFHSQSFTVNPMAVYITVSVASRMFLSSLSWPGIALHLTFKQEPAILLMEVIP